ncbi:hypothetical protein OSCI_320006 [Kamptonema sp. PCC 6506]|nr:hypothetical protein OSCI_320006 [Kamptonema sp. PCC 6506]
MLQSTKKGIVQIFPTLPQTIQAFQFLEATSTPDFRSAMAEKIRRENL